MGFWIAFIVVAIAWWLSRRGHDDMQQQLQDLTARLGKAEGEVDLLRRAHRMLLTKVEQGSGATKRRP